MCTHTQRIRDLVQNKDAYDGLKEDTKSWIEELGKLQDFLINAPRPNGVKQDVWNVAQRDLRSLISNLAGIRSEYLLAAVDADIELAHGQPWKCPDCRDLLVRMGRLPKRTEVQNETV